MSGKDEAAEEILIIRRRGGGEEEGHHGGVWKIAYADFMTAMMAFFLVMWLINASNTETKASIASYFNPMRLTDTVSRKKGLRNIDAKSNVEDSSALGESDESTEKADGGREDSKFQEKHTQKAGNKSDTEQPREKSETTEDASNQRQTAVATAENAAPAIRREELDANATSMEHGRAFRDPFNPLSGTRLLHDKNAKRDLGNGSNSNAPVAKRDRDKRQHANAAHAASSVMQAVPPGSEANNQVTKPAGVVTPPGNEASAKASAARIAKARQLETTAAKIRREAEEAKRKLGATGGPGIDVTIEGEDIVVSLTDTSSFGMFAVGSAVPNTGLVSLVSSITPLVAANGNRIILRGHTDARPFLRDGKNQNWRLAMERAEAAYEMLLKAGIDDARFEKIEAYADRKPKIPADPQAAANRRIEIILRK